MDTPTSLRLCAAEILELSAKARSTLVARDLEALAGRYLAAARELENDDRAGNSDVTPLKAS